jgi:hypothetical protein
MDPETQAFVDSHFGPDGEPVETGDVGSFTGTDDDFLYDRPAFTSESELVDAYVQASGDEAAVNRAQELVDAQNFETLALQEQLAEDGVLSDHGYQEEPGFVQPGAPQQPGETDEQFAYRVAGETMQQYLAGQAMQPAPPTAEQQLSAAIAAATTESLASLAAIEESKAARAAEHDAQAEYVYNQQLNEAAAVADDLIGKALERHGAKNYDRAEVLEAASAVMEANGWVGPEFDALSQWEREQYAKAAIDKAASLAHDAAVTAYALGPQGWKGWRTR